MRFLTWLACFRKIFAMTVGPPSDQAEQAAQHFADRPADLAAKQKDGHQRLEGGVVSVGMVDPFAVMQIGVGMGGQGDEGLQVVAVLWRRPFCAVKADDWNGHKRNGS